MYTPPTLILLLVLVACDEHKDDVVIGDTSPDTGEPCATYTGPCPTLTAPTGASEAPLVTAWQCLDEDCAPAEVRLWGEGDDRHVVAYCVDLAGETGDAYDGAWDTLHLTICQP